MLCNPPGNPTVSPTLPCSGGSGVYISDSYIMKGVSTIQGSLDFQHKPRKAHYRIRNADSIQKVHSITLLITQRTLLDLCHCMSSQYVKPGSGHHTLPIPTCRTTSSSATPLLGPICPINAHPEHALKGPSQCRAETPQVAHKSTIVA